MRFVPGQLDSQSSLWVPGCLLRLLIWFLNCLLRRLPGIIQLEASLPVNHPLIWLILERKNKLLEGSSVHVTVDLMEVLQALNLTPDPARAQLNWKRTRWETTSCHMSFQALNQRYKTRWGFDLLKTLLNEVYVHIKSETSIYVLLRASTSDTYNEAVYLCIFLSTVHRGIYVRQPRSSCQRIFYSQTFYISDRW